MVMKKLMAILIGMMLGVILAQAQKLEISVAPNYVFPSEKDTWDKAYGIEGQLRLWANEYVGIAAAGGIQRWDINETSDALILNDEILAVTDFTGSANMVPLGGSLLIRPIPADWTKLIQLTIEGGVRYVFVNSNVKGTMVETDPVSVSEGNVDMDNGLIGLVAGDVGIVPLENFSIFVGGGYQFDLSKGNVDWLDSNISDNKMKGWFVRGGVTLMF
ncbi:MAG: hypothetical protein KKG09_04220 [Verrucomicrobia bacterium]|nr:hypothetical protein [Verrucomicrobiota bacterium]MBU4497191.1 hypothetical protein [Verrucomicrobiota bacterium]